MGFVFSEAVTVLCLVPPPETISDQPQVRGASEDERGAAGDARLPIPPQG